MSTEREQPPCGYYISFSNNPEHPCWLVMRWGHVEAVCATLEEAYRWLENELGGVCE